MRMRWLFGRGNVRAPWIVAILVLMNALLLRATDPPELSRLRDLAFDSYQRLKPRTYKPAMPVRIVDIDEAALAEYGQWPWPRTIVARLVDKLTEKGAAVIAFDVVFAEPDRSSISRMVRDLAGRRPTPRLRRLAGEGSRTTTRSWPTRSAHARGGHGLRLRPQGRHRTAAPIAGMAHSSGESERQGAR